MEVIATKAKKTKTKTKITPGGNIIDYWYELVKRDLRKREKKKVSKKEEERLKNFSSLNFWKLVNIRMFSSSRKKKKTFIWLSDKTNIKLAEPRTTALLLKEYPGVDIS